MYRRSQSCRRSWNKSQERLFKQWCNCICHWIKSSK
uniref:Uncharacterized protein n=1 Tax=Lepeophtheirus salmonis TaxID=72036 RepID=A0A0K2UXN6_LEPSM